MIQASKRILFNRIKRSMKTILREDMRLIEKNMMSEKESLEYAVDRYNRRSISELELDRIRTEFAARESSSRARIRVMEAQINAVDDIESAEELLVSPVLNQREFVVSKWNMRAEQAGDEVASAQNMLARAIGGDVNMPSELRQAIEPWGISTMQGAFITASQHMVFSETARKDIMRLVLRCNTVFQELDGYYRAIGFALPLPETSEAPRGGVDFQQFVPLNPIPLEKEPTRDEVERHSGAIKALRKEYLGLLGQIKEVIAREGIRAAAG
jgi:hypothetical protein